MSTEDIIIAPSGLPDAAVGAKAATQPGGFLNHG